MTSSHQCVRLRAAAAAKAAGVRCRAAAGAAGGTTPGDRCGLVLFVAHASSWGHVACVWPCRSTCPDQHPKPKGGREGAAAPARSTPLRLLNAQPDGKHGSGRRAWWAGQGGLGGWVGWGLAQEGRGPLRAAGGTGLPAQGHTPGGPVKAQVPAPAGQVAAGCSVRRRTSHPPEPAGVERRAWPPCSAAKPNGAGAAQVPDSFPRARLRP
jgi:hypothetical protein